MGIEIREVISKKDLKKFVKFPFTLYKGNQYWAPPFISDEINTLDRNTNPAFEYCKAKYWLAYKDGKVAGRIAAIINNTLIAKWNVKKARFGWIDFIDDVEVSTILLQTVEKWAKENDLESIEGPMGFTDMDEEGMLIEGFEEQGTYPMIYNYSYYPEHLKNLGYEKEVDWLEFEITVPDTIPEKIVRVNDLILKRSKLHLLNAKKAKDVKPYLPGFWDLIEESYADLFGTIPFTEKQKKFYTDQYFGFLIPEYTKFIINEKNEIVAVGLIFPSFTEALRKANGRKFPFGLLYMLLATKKPTKLDFYLIGVKKEYIGNGVISIMMNEINKNAIKNGIKCCETSGELEDNKAVQDMWRHYEHRQHKRRRCFIKAL
jgi:hypothetical protein